MVIRVNKSRSQIMSGKRKRNDSSIENRFIDHSAKVSDDDGSLDEIEDDFRSSNSNLSQQNFVVHDDEDTMELPNDATFYHQIDNHRNEKQQHHDTKRRTYNNRNTPSLLQKSKASQSTKSLATTKKIVTSSFTNENVECNTNITMQENDGNSSSGSSSTSNLMRTSRLSDSGSSNQYLRSRGANNVYESDAYLSSASRLRKKQNQLLHSNSNNRSAIRKAVTPRNNSLQKRTDGGYASTSDDLSGSQLELSDQSHSRRRDSSDRLSDYDRDTDVQHKIAYDASDSDIESHVYSFGAFTNGTPPWEYTDRDMNRILIRAYKMFILENPITSPTKMIEYAYRCFKIEENETNRDVPIADIDARYNQMTLIFVNMMGAFAERNYLNRLTTENGFEDPSDTSSMEDDDDAATSEYQSSSLDHILRITPKMVIEQCLRLLAHLRNMLMFSMMSWSVSHRTELVYVPTDIEMYNPTVGFGPDITLTDAQYMTMWFLPKLRAEGLIRHRNLFFYQIRTPEGHGTRCYARHCEIARYVYNSVDVTVNHALWNRLTHSPSTQTHVVEMLTNCKSSELLNYNPNRHLQAFRNGIYITKLHKFIRYEKMHLELPSEYHMSHCCSYSDIMFDEEYLVAQFSLERKHEFMEIQTPELDKILDHQSFSHDVKEWFYALSGRILYAVREMDNWQVIMFLRGLAGSGKSTIIEELMSPYSTEFVSSLGNKFDERFGMAALNPERGILVWNNTEIRNTFGMSQSDFQKLISGEPVMIEEKNKNQFSAVISAPGLIGGNERMNYKDSGGSIARRIVEFVFDYFVVKSDPQLKEKLRKEHAHILVKTNLAYHSKLELHRNQDLWNGPLPNYFKEVRRQLEIELNPFENFITTSGLFEDDVNSYVPMNKLKALYTPWCNDNGISTNDRKVSLQVANMKKTIQIHGYSYEPEDNRMWEGRMTGKTAFLVGVRLIDGAAVDTIPIGQHTRYG